VIWISAASQSGKKDLIQSIVQALHDD